MHGLESGPARPVPGSAATPRGRIPARVVAANGSSITEPTEYGSGRSSDVHCSARSQDAQQPTTVQEGTSYVPYVHVATGARTLVKMRVDRDTGMLTELAPPPAGFLPDLVVNPVVPREELSRGCLDTLLRACLPASTSVMLGAARRACDTPRVARP